MSSEPIKSYSSKIGTTNFTPSDEPDEGGV